RGSFIWDDRLLVDKNPLVTGRTNLFSVWFQTDFPFTLTFLWMQWLVFGKTPLGFHVVNVLLHCLSAVLVWRVLLRLRVQGAWLGALLFAVHPVCVASAGWISEQKNTLSLVFYLLALIWYLRAGRGETKTNRMFYWLSLAAFLVGLLSKTSTVMLP